MAKTTNITDIRNFAWHYLREKNCGIKVSIYNKNVGEWNIYMKCVGKEKDEYLLEKTMHEIEGTSQLISLLEYKFNEAEFPKPTNDYYISKESSSNFFIASAISKTERYEVIL